MLLDMLGGSIVLHICTAILSACDPGINCLLVAQLDSLREWSLFLSLSTIVHSQLVGCIKEQSNLMNRVSLYDIGLNTRLHAMLPCIASHTGMT